MRQNDSIAGAAADSSEHLGGAGGFPGAAGVSQEGASNAGTFSMRQRNAALANRESAGPESAQRAAPVQRAASDNKPNTTSEAGHRQGAARGNATSTQTAPESRGNTDGSSAKTLYRAAVPDHSESQAKPGVDDTITSARLVVTPPRNVAQARLRVVGSAHVRLSQNGVLSQIVWAGAARSGQEVVVTLRLRITAPGTLRVVLEEDRNGVWKTVREQNLSVPSR
jgi:hypothetical protein